MTTLKSNDSGLLLVKMKDNSIKNSTPEDLVIVLDGINDPGNL
jgi:tRNA G18 (ribose-2'-O)-methylase SpoU